MATHIRIILLFILSALSVFVIQSNNKEIKIRLPDHMGETCEQLASLTSCANLHTSFQLIKNAKHRSTIIKETEEMKKRDPTGLFLCMKESELEDCFSHYMRKVMAKSITDSCGTTKTPDTIEIKHNRSLFSI